MTLHLHVTEAAVGTCDECGLTKSHLTTCTVAMVQQVVVQIDVDAPAKPRIRLHQLAQELGQPCMIVREAVAHISGVVPSSSSAMVRHEVAEGVRQHLAVTKDGC